MIYGIGTDIVDVDRIQQGIDRHGERYAMRILSDDELSEFQSSARPAHFLAKRFAAKEAVAKALGTGFRDGLSLRHISVGHESNGKPIVQLTGRAAQIAEQLGVGESHLSLSDELRYAVAFVTLMRAA